MAGILAAIPWWLSFLVLLVGVSLMVYANKRAHAGLRSIGLVVVSLGVLLLASGFLIDTDAEKCAARSRKLVDAVSRKDWDGMTRLLDTDTAVDFGSKFPALRGPKEIKDFGERTDKEVKLQGASIWTLHTEQTPQMIQVLFTAYTKQEATADQAVPSNWEFDYTPSGKKWDLSQIKMTSLGNEATQ